MLASLIADGILILHLAWIVFAILGGLLALRWPRVAWVHLGVVVWSAWVILAGWVCPLTPLENHFRWTAGQEGYQDGFVEHYITALVYPPGLTRALQIGLGVAILLWNAVIYALVFHRRNQEER